MKDLNLLEAIEKSEEEFCERYLSHVFNKLKAARRALILLLMVRDQIGLNEKTGEPFDDIEQAYIELAAAVFANGRAAFLLIMNGYLFPAQILLRALWEQVVFMEYFRLYPDECRTWVVADDPSAARTPRPQKAWGAVKAKAQDSVLGGKRDRLYDYLSQHAHSHRYALSDLTVAVSDKMAGTAFGPAYEPTDLGLIVELMTSLLVSAVEVLEKVFETRIRDTGGQPLKEVLKAILELAFEESPVAENQLTNGVLER